MVLPERIEVALMAAVDNETDPAIAAQIQATLHTLLRAGAAAAPSYWLSVCSTVALAAPAGGADAGPPPGAPPAPISQLGVGDALLVRTCGHSCAHVSGFVEWLQSTTQQKKVWNLQIFVAG